MATFLEPKWLTAAHKTMKKKPFHEAFVVPLLGRAFGPRRSNPLVLEFHVIPERVFILGFKVAFRALELFERGVRAQV